jgi:hypothetical protein
MARSRLAPTPRLTSDLQARRRNPWHPALAIEFLAGEDATVCPLPHHGRELASSSRKTARAWRYSDALSTSLFHSASAAFSVACLFSCSVVPSFCALLSLAWSSPSLSAASLYLPHRALYSYQPSSRHSLFSPSSLPAIGRRPATALRARPLVQPLTTHHHPRLSILFAFEIGGCKAHRCSWTWPLAMPTFPNLTSSTETCETYFVLRSDHERSASSWL